MINKNQIIDIENIDGKILKQIYVIRDDDGDTSGALLYFENNLFLYIFVEPLTDEVNMTCFEEENIKNVLDLFSISIFESSVFLKYYERKVIFYWVMINQNGYTDAFQIELSPNSSTFTIIQFIARASLLEIYTLDTLVHGR